MDFPSLVDLQEMLSLTEVQANARVWKDMAGNLTGFAILTRDETSCSLIFEVAPHAIQINLVAQIIAWGEQTAWQACPSYRGLLVLETRCLADDLARRSILEQHSFVKQSVGALHLFRPLDELVPPPLPPTGFSIRSLAGEPEVEAWVTLHRAAFCTQNMTIEYRQAMMKVQGFEPDLDLVAVAPDGTLAAYCVGSINEEENRLTGQKVGFTDPVATHPAYQRQGLARALLLEALDQLKKRGMLTARLNTNSENTAMQRAAQSAGFRELSRSITFSKTVSSNNQIAGKIA